MTASTFPSSSPPVPPPGPRPPAYVFPFPEARAAVAAIEATLDDLAASAAAHDAAAAEACVGFTGHSRSAFEANLGACLDRLTALRRQLDADAASLRRQLVAAERAHDARERAIRDWQARARAYEADRAARRRAATRH